MFQQRHLDRLARQLRQEYTTNAPFPHIVIDDFLPEEIAEKLLAAFPSPEGGRWEEFDAEHEVKLQLSNEERMHPYVRDLLHQFNAAPMIEFLERLTDIDGLVPDPHFMGGGLHQIEPGGFLDIHADFNYHPRLQLDRRLNLLLYLNKNWREEYNGHLELWDREMTGCVKKIAPLFNRCVIFNTTDFSYHGHPEVLRCPPGTTRKSMALYYYSNGRPAGERSSGHSTLFRVRPDEDTGSKSSRMRRIKRTVRRLIPPILFDAISAARQRGAA
jgi:Rps23 Pro-64 3,4-dihydroxylase Tpa1-like proline 4-hydroxylase